MTVYLNKSYEIYDSNGDAAIDVTCDDSMVRVKVADDDLSQEWFGKFDFSVSYDVAKKLAQAILAVVSDNKDNETKGLELTRETVKRVREDMKKTEGAMTVDSPVEVVVDLLNLLDETDTASPQQADGMYYLQDARWSAMVGNCPSWWRPDGNGYTTNLDEAARFNFDEAMAQHRCRDTDLPWLCSEVDKLRRPTVDCQYMPRSWDAQRESIAAIAAAKEK